MVKLSLAIPTYEGRHQNPHCRLRMGSSFITAAAPATVTGGSSENVVGAYIFGTRNEVNRDFRNDPYTAGSSVPYRFRVYSAGNTTEAVVPTAGPFVPFQPPGGGNCRFIRHNFQDS